MLAAGMAIMVVGDAGFGPMALQDDYQSGDWPDVLWAVSVFLMGRRAQFQCWRARDPSATGVVGKAGVRLASPLPYAAAALSQAMLVGVVLFHGLEMAGGLAFGSVAVTVLVIVRQLVGVREN